MTDDQIRQGTQLSFKVGFSFKSNVPVGSLGSNQSRPSKMSRGSQTSKTMTVRYLKWSLGWTVQLGIFNRKIFLNEMMRASKRKSTLEPAQRMLIQRNSAEYE